MLGQKKRDEDSTFLVVEDKAPAPIIGLVFLYESDGRESKVGESDVGESVTNKASIEVRIGYLFVEAS